VEDGCGAGAALYRGHCIEVVRRRRGWLVRITPATLRDALAPEGHSAEGQAMPAPATMLRNNVPRGRATLVAEAHARIDRMIDGPPWQGSA
jgi:hypothetical protein